MIERNIKNRKKKCACMRAHNGTMRSTRWYDRTLVENNYLLFSYNLYLIISIGLLFIIFVFLSVSSRLFTLLFCFIHSLVEMGYLLKILPHLFKPATIKSYKSLNQSILDKLSTFLFNMFQNALQLFFLFWFC